jgi:hypothetical protein
MLRPELLAKTEKMSGTGKEGVLNFYIVISEKFS